MKNLLLLFSSLFSLILLTACETTNSRSNQFAGSNQDIIELRNGVAALKRKIANVQNNNVRVAKNLSSLQSQINYVNEQNQQQNKVISTLRQTIKQERAERQAALKRVIETVAEQTAKTVNSIAEQSQPKAVKTPALAASGAYYKHKVEPGETLSAIARAYKVSVKDIKQTSGIKGDMIRVGQILHIPKK